MNSSLSWINGNYTDFANMAVPVWDLGVVAGASITEMARTFGHRPFRMAEHLERLLAACAEVKFGVPFSAAELLDVAHKLIENNVQSLDSADDLGIVTFVTAGANRTYLGEGPLPGPTVGLHTFRLPLELWRSTVEHGVKLQVPECRQPDTSLPVHLKTRNRLHWILADQQAQEIEPGSKSLLLDSQNCVTETSTACFYGVLFGTVVTPSGGVLDSMSRRMVTEALHAANIPFKPGPIPELQLPHLSEAFLSSTPVGILPVQSINGRPLPFDLNGPMYQALRDHWKQQTKIDPVAQLMNAAPF